MASLGLIGVRDKSSSHNYDLSHFMRGWLANAPKTRGSLKLEVDIDPQSFIRRYASANWEG